MISDKVKNISPSLTLSISAKAKAMKAKGIDVIGFGAGEPDFDTLENIKEKAKSAIDKGYTKYTPVSGIDSLKEAIVDRTEKDKGLKYNKNQVIVSPGAKYAISEIILSLVNPGEEVIIPSPYWLSYPEMVKLSGGKPVFIKTLEKDGFKVTAESLDKAVSSKTRLVILNSPSNPTGSIYSLKELKEIADIIEKHNILCISDEIYDKLTYTGNISGSIASVSESVKEKAIVVNGVSKTYAMTGWRIGYALGPEEIISAASRIQSHTTSNPSSISQYAALEALTGPQNAIQEMKGEFKERRDFMVNRINSISGLSVNMPEGAFYCFVNISSCINKSLGQRTITGSLSFSEILLDEEKTAVVPGAVFGDDNYVRLSYAVSLDSIKEGLTRVERFINKLG